MITLPSCAAVANRFESGSQLTETTLPKWPLSDRLFLSFAGAAAPSRVSGEGFWRSRASFTRCWSCSTATRVARSLALSSGLLSSGAMCVLSASVPSGGCPSVRRRRSRAQVRRMGLGMCFLASKAPLRRRLAGSADGTAHSSTAGKSHREGADVIGRPRPTARRRGGDFSPTAARSATARRRRQEAPCPSGRGTSSNTSYRGERGTLVGLAALAALRRRLGSALGQRRRGAMQSPVRGRLGSGQVLSRPF